MTDPQIDIHWPDSFTIAHCLGCLYLTFAAHADEELSADETAVIQEKLGGWPFVEDLDETMCEVTEYWEGLTQAQTFTMLETVTSFLKSAADVEHLRAMYADLESVARADGRVVEEEVQWLEMIREDWGL